MVRTFFGCTVITIAFFAGGLAAGCLVADILARHEML